MYPDDAIRAALAPLGLDVVRGAYMGDRREYIAYKYHAIPNAHGDNSPAQLVYLIWLDYWCLDGAADRRIVRRTIMRLLTNAGFTAPAETDISDVWDRAQTTNRAQGYSYETQGCEGWVAATDATP